MLKHVIKRTELANLPPVTQDFYRPSDPANVKADDAEFLLSVPDELPGQYRQAMQQFMQQNAAANRARIKANAAKVAAGRGG